MILFYAIFTIILINFSSIYGLLNVNLNSVRIRTNGHSKCKLNTCTESFEIQDHVKFTNSKSTTVFKVSVQQPGITMYIANDGDLQSSRPGNGGMRLLSYQSEEDAIADSVRLAEGMTRKHNMYNTGFSGAKLVVNHGNIALEEVDRNGLMNDCAKALKSLDGTI